MIDRRSFLKRLGFLAAAAAISPSVLRPVIVREEGIRVRQGSKYIGTIPPNARYLRVVTTFGSDGAASTTTLQESDDMRTWRSCA